MRPLGAETNFDPMTALRTFLALLVVCVAMTLSGCDDGCVTCTGITADKRVCKDDYQNDSDYAAYIREYENQGGICED